jgi:hypothetical protein
MVGLAGGPVTPLAPDYMELVIPFGPSPQDWWERIMLGRWLSSTDCVFMLAALPTDLQIRAA